jgi:hypothetical protein
MMTTTQRSYTFAAAAAAVLSSTPAPAHDALLLARPVSASIVGPDPTPTTGPDFINTDMQVRVRFRVISVLAGTYPRRDIQLLMRAHQPGAITGIHEWSILLRDTPSGEVWEANPIARLVCMSVEAQRSAFLGNHQWIDPIGHGTATSPLGDVVCGTMNRHRNELD